MRTISIELPETVTVKGMGDAPDTIRNVKTENWTPEFCLTAMIHGVSQKIGDTWSVTKKDVDKTTKVFDNMVAGEWATRERNGATAAKFDNAIKSLNAEALFGKLTKEQLAALASMIKPD